MYSAIDEMVLEVEELHRALPMGDRPNHVLRGISFSIAAGEWVAITGPSGSGKSTLLGILAGIDRPTAGRVQVCGNDIDSLPERKLARIRNEKIGVVFQSFHLIPTMTALENIEAPLYIGPRWRQARVLAREMLARVSLVDRLDHLPHQLSGGEQQRVAIARALVAGPRLLLADEPTGNLDSATSRQILALLRHLRRQLGLTILMVTHDAQVAAYADRRLHMVDGKLAEDVSLPARNVALAEVCA
jgi:putative ABC transport system ATP-binding protein